MYSGPVELYNHVVGPTPSGPNVSHLSKEGKEGGGYGGREGGREGMKGGCGEREGMEGGREGGYGREDVERGRV